MATVLVVDDNVWAQQTLCSALEKCGYQTAAAADLAGVRQLLHQAGPTWRPDLILVELVRERGNGFSVAAWLQSRGQGTVVLLSERDDAADRLWARSRGVQHTASRAAGLDRLCALLRGILEGGDSARPV